MGAESRGWLGWLGLGSLWGRNEGLGSPTVEQGWSCGLKLWLGLLSLYWPSPRQTGMGLMGIFSRIGGILTPLVILLGEYHAALPMLIYGSLPIGAGLLCALLPETRGQPLKDTIKDLEQGPHPR